MGRLTTYYRRKHIAILSDQIVQDAAKEKKAKEQLQKQQKREAKANAN